jgi:hypothetical protein
VRRTAYNLVASRRQLAEKMLADAGFAQVETKDVEGDLFNNYYVAVKTE